MGIVCVCGMRGRDENEKAKLAKGDHDILVSKDSLPLSCWSFIRAY